FPGSLDPGDEVAVELSWTRSGLDGDPNDLDQVSPALVAIEVFAVGSSGGEAELTVEVPTGFEVVESSELIVGEVDGRVVFHSSVAESYADHTIVLSAPDRLLRTPVPDVELDITVASLPGFDPSLVAVLGDVVSILTGWFPVENPGPIEFRHGWTGGDDVRLIVGGAASATATSEVVDTLVVVVSPSTEVSVVARELAAAWLAPIPFESSQLEEALARVFGDAAARELGAEPAAHSVENPWVAVLAPAFAELDSSATAGVIEVLANGWLSYPGLSPLQH
ncbi:MAG: hypothetical protein GY773_03200, partial [Actinomycetia bacterium]|nr:hypothetical protein [Actinomycetes bacterium]